MRRIASEREVHDGSGSPRWVRSRISLAVTAALETA